MKKLASLAVAVVIIESCSRPSPAPIENRAGPSTASVAPARAPAQPQPQPATVDPQSTQAAVDLAQGFVGLINEGKFDEAYMLLGPNAPARREFDARFSSLSDLKATIGSAGDQEGAAGSIYVSVPLTVSGRSNGQRVSRAATLVIRRVNDVPGSTEAQRRWHIERIDWTTGP